MSLLESGSYNNQEKANMNRFGWNMNSVHSLISDACVTTTRDVGKCNTIYLTGGWAATVGLKVKCNFPKMQNEQLFVASTRNSVTVIMGWCFKVKARLLLSSAGVRWKLLGSNFSGIGSCILYLSAELSTSCLYPKGWRVTFAFPVRARHLSYRVHTDDRKHFLEGKTCAVRLKWTTPKAREERFQSGSETLQN